MDLSGGRNSKTSLAILEFYPKERKTFLLDIREGFEPDLGVTRDERLIQNLRELAPTLLAANVPTSFPPCVTCQKKCPLPRNCHVPEVKWMREWSRRKLQHREWTPYTQRAIELWVRSEFIEHLPKEVRPDLDETLGGSKAPLTSRMNFLKRHLVGPEVLEVWPKISLLLLARRLRIPKRVLVKVRDLEYGASARQEILDTLCATSSLFIYEGDQRRLAESLGVFDAFLCAWVGLLHHLKLTEARPTKFPRRATWLTFPQVNEDSRLP
jgi:hypothetical protein